MGHATKILGLCLIAGFATTASAQAAGTDKSLNTFGYGHEYPQRVAPITQTGEHAPLLQPVKVAPVAKYRPNVVIQVGAFADYSNARKRAQQLSGYGPTRIVDSLEYGQRLYRVFLGDFSSKTEARPLLNRIKARGYDGFVKTP